MKNIAVTLAFTCPLCCVVGAINRARAARKSLNADFGVGIEGGVEKIVDRWFESG